MKKDEIFFSDKGLTNTSANYIANLAKEYVQTYDKAMNNLSFYQTSIQIIGSSEVTPLKEGNTQNQLEQIPEIISKIAKAKSLIAWLREAIKAREKMTSEVSCITSEKYCEMMGIEFPQTPKRDHVLTEDEYYGSLSVKERNRYYQLETEAATLGKFIHPDGKYAKAREDLKDVCINPHKVDGKGRDALIYNYEPTVEVEYVDNQFFELQKKHREIQAQLNKIKHDCETAVAESQNAADNKYSKEYEEFNVAYSEVCTLAATYRHTKIQEISNLKIIIPDSLKDIYDEISSLGKK